MHPRLTLPACPPARHYSPGRALFGAVLVAIVALGAGQHLPAVGVHVFTVGEDVSAPQAGRQIPLGLPLAGCRRRRLPLVPYLQVCNCCLPDLQVSFPLCVGALCGCTGVHTQPNPASPPCTSRPSPAGPRPALRPTHFIAMVGQRNPLGQGLNISVRGSGAYVPALLQDMAGQAAGTRASIRDPGTPWNMRCSTRGSHLLSLPNRACLPILRLPALPTAAHECCIKKARQRHDCSPGAADGAAHGGGEAGAAVGAASGLRLGEGAGRADLRDPGRGPAGSKRQGASIRVVRAWSMGISGGS